MPLDTEDEMLGGDFDGFYDAVGGVCCGDGVLRDLLKRLMMEAIDDELRATQYLGEARLRLHVDGVHEGIARLIAGYVVGERRG